MQNLKIIRHKKWPQRDQSETNCQVTQTYKERDTNDKRVCNKTEVGRKEGDKRRRITTAKRPLSPLQPQRHGCEFRMNNISCVDADSLYRTTTLAESPWASLEEMRFTRDVQLLAHSCYFIRPRVRWCMNSRQPVGLAVSLKTKTVQSKCQSLNLYPIKTIVTKEWTHVLNKRHPCSLPLSSRVKMLFFTWVSHLWQTHTREDQAHSLLSRSFSLCDSCPRYLVHSASARTHTHSAREVNSSPALVTRT